MRIDRTNPGQIELRLSANPEEFEHYSELVRALLNGVWVEKLDGLDQSYWDLTVQAQKFTLHREHYLGVSIFAEDNASTRSLLEKLKRSLEESAARSNR